MNPNLGYLFLIVFHCGRTNNWVSNVTQLQECSKHKKALDKKPH